MDLQNNLERLEEINNIIKRLNFNTLEIVNIAIKKNKEAIEILNSMEEYEVLREKTIYKLNFVIRTEFKHYLQSMRKCYKSGSYDIYESIMEESEKAIETFLRKVKGLPKKQDFDY